MSEPLMPRGEAVYQLRLMNSRLGMLVNLQCIFILLFILFFLGESKRRIILTNKLKKTVLRRGNWGISV